VADVFDEPVVSSGLEAIATEEVPAIDTEHVPAGDDEREQMVLNLIKRFDSYANHRKNVCEIETIWDACYRAYRGYKPDKGPYEFIYVIREIFRQIETLKPQLYEQFFESAELFEYQAEEPGFEEQAKGATAIVRRQIRYRKLERELRRWIDNAILYGTSFMVAYWKTFAIRKLKMSASYDVEAKETWWDRETEERFEEGPTIEAIPPWRVYAHPDIEDPRESPVVFITDVVSASALKTFVRAGYMDRAAVKKAAEESNAAGASGEDRQNQHLTSHPWFEDDKNLDESHALLTCWTNDGWEYVILDRKWIVRARRSDFPMPSILTLKNYPQQDELWGLPEPLQMLDDQNLLNDMMGLYVTGIHMTITPMVKAFGGDAAKKWKNIVFRPGGSVNLEAGEDIVPLNLTPHVLQLPTVAGFIMRNMKVSSGLTDELSGISGSKKTATEHVSLREAASARMRYKVVTFAPAFVEVFELLYQMNALYLDEDQAIRLGGQGGAAAFKFVRPDVFLPRVSVVVKLANNIEVGAEASLKWMNVYARVGQDPMVNREKIIERIFKALGEKDTKIFLSDPILSMSDALLENDKVMAYGILDLPKANDDHQQHYKIHMLAMQTDMFKQLPDLWQQAMIRHMTAHQEYLSAQMKQSQMAQQAGGGGELGQDSGSPVPATDIQTEALFDNGAQGAMQQGGVA
jgi:hypothetical protein